MSHRPGDSGDPPAKRSKRPHLTDRERDCLGTLRTLERQLGRQPTIEEVSTSLGLSRNAARVPIEHLVEKGYYDWEPGALTAKQLECLRAIDSLSRSLGRSPSIREVSAEMGMSEGGSRIHIRTLVARGLITPPEMVLVMNVTEAGKKLL